MNRNQHSCNSSTTPELWGDIWKQYSLPYTINAHSTALRGLIKVLMQSLAVTTARSVCEVGCAIGSWLAYIHKVNPKIQLAGIENSPEAYDITIQNLALQGVMADIRLEDCLNSTFPEEFDVVFSMGLVEHFRDPGPVIRAHWTLVKPRGVMLLTVPNFVGGYFKLLRRYSPSQMQTHNITTCNFRGLADAIKSALVCDEYEWVQGGTVGGPSLAYCGSLPLGFRALHAFLEHVGMFFSLPGLSPTAFAILRRIRI
jgi:2-polyprenyl-3-methyl-5-hydroxy-6-metoxy-1,4-benzoquinol methylase